MAAPGKGAQELAPLLAKDGESASRQRVHSLALQFLKNPAMVQQAHAVAQSQAQSQGDPRYLHLITAAAHLAQQLRDRHQQQQQQQQEQQWKQQQQQQQQRSISQEQSPGSREGAFSPGHVVWAKLEDFPYWPAQVLARHDPFVPSASVAPSVDASPVRFFGTYDFSWIEADWRLAPFQSAFEAHCHISDDLSFATAIAEAQQFLRSGELPHGFHLAMMNPAPPQPAPTPSGLSPAALSLGTDTAHGSFRGPVIKLKLPSRLMLPPVAAQALSPSHVRSPVSPVVPARQRQPSDIKPVQGANDELITGGRGFPIKMNGGTPTYRSPAASGGMDESPLGESPGQGDSSSGGAESEEEFSRKPARTLARKPAERVVRRSTEAREVRQLRLKRRLGLAPPAGSPWATRVCYDGVRQLAANLPVLLVEPALKGHA